MTRADQRVVLVVAQARNRVIGDGPDIPWRIPGEQAQFKEVTWGHILLMGRTTFEAIGRPLPGRATIVLTRDRAWVRDGVHVAHSVAEALELAAGLPGDLMVSGGGEIYAALLPLATHAVVSQVHAEPAGDAFFPELGREWAETAREAYDGYDRVFMEREHQLCVGPPTVEDYLRLREEAGLSPRTTRQAEGAVAGSWRFCHVRHLPTGETVAMGRLIGDGGWNFHVVDMAVLPSHQRLGLGDRVLTWLIDEVRREAPGAYLSLFADPPGRRLYERHGFREGVESVGMTMVLDEERAQ